VECINL